MIIRTFEESDHKAVGEIVALHWTDPEFIKELSDELRSSIQKKPEKGSRFFVAKENNEIVGIAGFRKLPTYLKSFALTNNPVEFYVIAVKHKRIGIGEKLKSKLVDKAREEGFSEMLLYSPGSHNESWDFHDTLGFERVGEITPPDDDMGYLWRKTL